MDAPIAIANHLGDFADPDFRSIGRIERASWLIARCDDRKDHRTENGLNPSSNGQLMKTALEAGGLAVRCVATRLLGLRPERVANGFSSGGAPTSYGGDFDAPIDDGPIEFRQGAL